MNRRRSAFTLIELLIVVAIIGIIAGFGIPAMTGMMKGSALTQASSLITDNIALARQHAITKNRTVEVRFYQYADLEQPGETAADLTSWKFRAFQYFELSESGVLLPVGKLQTLPDSVMMSNGEKLSTLLAEPAANGEPVRLVKSTDAKFNRSINPELPRKVGHNYNYVSFRFNPDGSTDLPPLGTPAKNSSGGRWYITVHTLADLERTRDGTVAPPDFVTWQIEPVSGTSKPFRPGLK